jgi:alkyl sulfatase BDS1-like metallo-beta-lactamase superfamily hydrolase
METNMKINIFQQLVNRLLFRKTRANRCSDQFLSCIESGAADGFLTILLKLMSLVLCINPEFRLNIKDFEAVYVFRDKNEKLYVTAEFSKNKLKVKQKRVEESELTLTFKDGKSLFKLLLSESPDVLDALLNQEVDFSGNINYLNKFAFMAMRLRLMADGKA